MKEAEFALIKEQMEKLGFFSRLAGWNDQRFIIAACIAALFTGASQPVFGGFLMADVLTRLTIPLNLYSTFYPGSNLEDSINEYCLWMAFIAVITFFAMFIEKYYALRSSELVTYHMRYTLYDSILSKNIGWFDLRDNGVGILTSSMAQDTSIVNGVSSESIGP